MSLIWASRKKWLEKGTPDIGPDNPIGLAITALVIFFGFPMAAIIFATMENTSLDPLTILKALMFHHYEYEDAIKGLLFLFFLSGLGSVKLGFANRRFNNDFLLVYDDHIYAHDSRRGGLMLKPGDVEQIIIFNLGMITITLKKPKRGIKYLSVIFEIRMPKEVADKMVEMLKPDRYAYITSPPNVKLSSYYTETVAVIAGPKDIKHVEDFLQHDQKPHIDALIESKHMFYGYGFGALLDYLYSKNKLREALTIALSITHPDPRQWAQAINKAIEKTFKHPKIATITTEKKAEDIIDNYGILGLTPSLLFALTIMLGIAIGINKEILNLITMTIGMLALYSVCMLLGLMMYFSFGSYYWSFYYLHDSSKAAVVFFVRVIFDIVILTFFTYTLIVNPIAKIIGIILSVATVILLCLISSCYVFFKGEELAENMVREIEAINPDIPKRVQEILGEI